MLSPGSVLGGRYQIVRAIGHGGMGEVYEATQLALARRVALKTIRADLASKPELLARFRREAESAAALGHPNLVQVTDFNASPGEPAFLVMEMLDGATLKDVMERDGRIEPARAAFIAVQLLAGLAAAHRAGIVHRDVKPGNIFLQSTSAMRDIVKVLDFGVAKLALDSTPGAKAMTQAGQVLGTLTYMAPEQGFAGAPIDARTDVFAVGATLFHALSGVRHLDAIEPTGGRTPLDRLAPWVHRDLAAVIERALQKSPDARWANADEMAAALQPFAASNVVPPSGDSGRAAPAAPGGWDSAAIGRLEAPTGGGSSYGAASSVTGGSSWGNATGGSSWNSATGGSSRGNATGGSSWGSATGGAIVSASATATGGAMGSASAMRDATLLGHGARAPGVHEAPAPIVPSPSAFAPSAYGPAPAVSVAAPPGAVPYAMPQGGAAPYAMPQGGAPMTGPPPPGYGPPAYAPRASYPSQGPPPGPYMPTPARRSMPPWWILVVAVVVLAVLVPPVLSMLAVRRATDPDTIATNVEREVLKQPKQPCPPPDQCNQSREEHGLTYPICSRKLAAFSPYKPGEMVLAGPDTRVGLITTGEQSGHRYGIRFLTSQQEQTLGDAEIIGRLCRAGSRGSNAAQTQ